jgi:hypothetical protein
MFSPSAVRRSFLQRCLVRRQFAEAPRSDVWCVGGLPKLYASENNGIEKEQPAAPAEQKTQSPQSFLSLQSLQSLQSFLSFQSFSLPPFVPKNRYSFYF